MIKTKKIQSEKDKEKESNIESSTFLFIQLKIDSGKRRRKKVVIIFVLAGARRPVNVQVLIRSRSNTPSPSCNGECKCSESYSKVGDCRKLVFSFEIRIQRTFWELEKFLTRSMAEKRSIGKIHSEKRIMAAHTLFVNLNFLKRENYIFVSA